MKKVVILLTLLFAVAIFAHADTKIELGLTIQLLQERTKRLQLEFTLTQDQLRKAQAKLKAIIDKEEAKRDKKKE